MLKAKMDYKAVLGRYYRLSKPGIVYANTLTAIAGYLYASAFHISWLTLLGLTIGIGALIAGACAYNNYLDRNIDAVMARTQKRGLVTGEISSRRALTYATMTTIGGLFLLALTQNRLTLLLTVIAFIDYVILYGISKRKSVHGTLVGCISGALPLVAGYTAVANRFDLQAWLLFALMVAWQMAHFYAIALYRLKDYKAAKIPVMPAVYGSASTKIQTVGYIVLFVGAVISLVVWGRLGLIGGVTLAGLGLWWLVRALASYTTKAPSPWGLQVFLGSLIVIMGMAASLAVGPLV